MRIEYMYNRYRKVKLSVPYGARETGPKRKNKRKKEQKKKRTEEKEQKKRKKKKIKRIKMKK